MQGCYAALLRPRDLAQGGSLATALQRVLRQFSSVEDAGGSDMQVHPQTNFFPSRLYSSYRGLKAGHCPCDRSHSSAHGRRFLPSAQRAYSPFCIQCALLFG